jgi:hypothetical protein
MECRSRISLKVEEESSIRGGTGWIRVPRLVSRFLVFGKWTTLEWSFLSDRPWNSVLHKSREDRIHVNRRWSTFFLGMTVVLQSINLGVVTFGNLPCFQLWRAEYHYKINS